MYFDPSDKFVHQIVLTRIMLVFCACTPAAHMLRPAKRPNLAQVESMRQGVPPPPRGAPAAPAPAAPAAADPAAAPKATPPSAALTSLGDPQIDWVALAAGMGVPGGRAETVGQLEVLVRQGLERDGPFLVMAVI